VGSRSFGLGYADRRAALSAEFADRIVPGDDGVFPPMVFSDDQIVGTWTQTGRGTRRTVAATPFTSFPRDVTHGDPRGIFGAAVKVSRSPSTWGNHAGLRNLSG
jgi:hypothetical protein